MEDFRRFATGSVILKHFETLKHISSCIDPHTILPPAMLPILFYHLELIPKLL